MYKIGFSIVFFVCSCLLFTQCNWKTSNKNIASSKVSEIVNTDSTRYHNDSTLSVVDSVQVPKDSAITSIKFDKEIYDFGTCTEGDKILKKIEFTNTGKLPLLITQVYGSCGCTVPTYSKAPVLAGKKGIIEVEFNSKNKPGANTKSVIVEANTYPPITTVAFSVKVKENKEKGFVDRFMN